MAGRLARAKPIWSPVELEYLRAHQQLPVNQLTVALAKSRSAVTNKLAELSDTATPKKTAPHKSTIQRSYIGKRPDLGLFLRSRMEANFLRVLKLDSTIVRIEYEPVDFTFFQFGHHKGTVSYTPDFKIWYSDNSYLWCEAKGGFLKAQDKTKLKRFKKYYPEEFARLTAVTPSPNSKTTKFFLELGIDVKWYYNQLTKQFKNIIPNWE